ncbi:MAG: hypothetical protein JSU66_00690 [Deltaproteobacteria bacterium]|nr:MAG: hypothetical protein JSU66_00690 [Deltaproteobacteria bacterium]
MAAWIGWIAACCAFAAAVALFFARRTLARRASDAEARLETVRTNLAALDKRFEERSAELRRRGEELGDLKRKLEKTRKRAAQDREAHVHEDDVRTRLEEDLALRTAEAHELRAELERTQAQLVQLGGEVRRLRERPPAPVANAPDVSRIEALERERTEARDEAARQRTALAAAEAANRTLRERADRHRKLYLVIKGQLDVAKERIRMLEALRVEHAPAKGGPPPPRDDA